MNPVSVSSLDQDLAEARSRRAKIASSQDSRSPQSQALIDESLEIIEPQALIDESLEIIEPGPNEKMNNFNLERIFGFDKNPA